MCFAISLFPATVLTVLGYIVLFCSSKASGGIAAFGKVLAVWVFVLAAVPPLVGAYVSIAGLCPIDRAIQSTFVGK